MCENYRGVGRDTESLGGQVTYFSLCYCLFMMSVYSPVSLADDKLTVQSNTRRYSRPMSRSRPRELVHNNCCLKSSSYLSSPKIRSRPKIRAQRVQRRVYWRGSGGLPPAGHARGRGSWDTCSKFSNVLISNNELFLFFCVKCDLILFALVRV